MFSIDYYKKSKYGSLLIVLWTIVVTNLLAFFLSIVLPQLHADLYIFGVLALLMGLVGVYFGVIEFKIIQGDERVWPTLGILLNLLTVIGGIFFIYLSNLEF